MRQGKFLFVILFLVGANNVLGQWTPSTGFIYPPLTSTNVGIGIATSPTAKLHVVATSGGNSARFAGGTALFSGASTTSDAIRVSSGTTSLGGGLIVGGAGNGASNKLTFGTDGIFDINTSLNGIRYDFKINNLVNGQDKVGAVLSTSSNMLFQTNSSLGATAYNFKFLNGNTELATLANNGSLSLIGDLKGNRTSGTFYVYGNSDYTNGPFIEFKGNTSTGTTGDIRLVAGVGNGTKKGDIVFARQNGATAGNFIESMMTIQANGLVGIGTPSPGYKLEVNGFISNGGSDFILGKLDGRSQGTKTAQRALVHDGGDLLWINYDGDFEGGVKMGGRGLAVKEVCVNQSIAWCDYVFEPDYSLMPLNQLQSFIQKNKHLPEIPTSAEVEKDGISLSKMVTLQMKKIEEMTLYILEMEARLKRIEIGR